MKTKIIKAMDKIMQEFHQYKNTHPKAYKVAVKENKELKKLFDKQNKIA